MGSKFPTPAPTDPEHRKPPAPATAPAVTERIKELEAGIRAQLGPLDQDQQTEVIARSLRSLRSSPDRPRVDHERPGP